VITHNAIYFRRVNNLISPNPKRMNRRAANSMLKTVTEEELHALAHKLKLAAVSDEHRAEALETTEHLLELITTAPEPAKAAMMLGSEPGILAALQSLLAAYTMDNATLLSGLTLLACIAGGPAACKEAISSSPCRLLGTVAALLSHQNPQLAAAAARCTKMLTSNAQPSVCLRLLQKQRTCGTPAVLLAQLVEAAAAAGPDSACASAGEEAAAALANLATAVPGQLVSQKGVVSALIAGMRSSDMQLQLLGAGAIAALAADPAAAAAAAKAKGAKLVPVLASLLEADAAELVCASAAALQCFALHCTPAFKEYIAAMATGHRHGKGRSTVTATLALLAGGSYSSNDGSGGVNKAVSRAAAQALAALLEGCPQNVKLLCKQDGPAGVSVVDMLIACLRSNGGHSSSSGEPSIKAASVSLTALEEVA
jgi:hypothetical protein